MQDHSSPPIWQNSPTGQYVLGWQAERYAQATADVFGYFALQLGCAALPTLAASRISHRYLALQHEISDFACPQLRLEYQHLPLQEASVDVLTLPHTLELCADPGAVLRDAARALVPQGRLLLSGFNPRGMWFSPAAQLHRRRIALPEPAQLLGRRQLLQLLHDCGLQLEALHYGCWQALHLGSAAYAPAGRSDIWGQRLLQPWGNCYFVQARKQVVGSTLLQAHWQTRRLSAVPASAIATPKEPL